MRVCRVGQLTEANALTASADDMMENLRKCATEPDDARRLACYDLEMARSTRAAAEQPSEVQAL